MKQLRETPDATHGGVLQCIVLSIMEHNYEGEAIRDSLSGQVVGFFYELEKWLVGAAKHLDGGLDSISKQSLIKQGNNGLAFDIEKYLKDLKEQL